MSSVWIVVSERNTHLIEDGFHVTGESARAQAEAKSADTRAAYDAVKQWLEISFEDYCAIKNRPVSYDVMEISDVAGEAGAELPSAVWTYIEEDEVTTDWGFGVSQRSADEWILNRDIAAHEYWEADPEGKSADVSFVRYYKERSWGTNRVQRVARHAAA